jgi:superfamily II DNA or RNA helicase
MEEWKVHVEGKYVLERFSGIKLRLSLSGSKKEKSGNQRLVSKEELFNKFPNDLLIKSLVGEHIQQLRASGYYEGEHSLNFKSFYVGKKNLYTLLIKLCKAKKLFFKENLVAYLEDDAKLCASITPSAEGFSYDLKVKVSGKKLDYQKKALVFREGLRTLVLFPEFLCVFSEDFDSYFFKILWKEEEFNISLKDLNRVKRNMEDAPVGFELIEGEFLENLIKAELKPALYFKNDQAKLCAVKFQYSNGCNVEAYDPVEELKGGDGVSIARDFNQEKDFLKDLKDLNINCFDRGLSYFICEDKNPCETFEMLQELGWDLLMPGNQKLLLSESIDYDLQKQNTIFELTGSISYAGGKKIALSDCFELVKGQARSIKVDEGVLLLPYERISEELGELLHIAEKGSGSLEVKKAFLGRLEAFCKRFDNLKKTLETDELVEVDLKGFSGDLRDYQREGVEWILKKYVEGFGALLADEMGLGKTVQVLAFLSSLKRKSKKHLILCPKTLQGHWMREIKRFLPTWNSSVFTGELPEEDEGILIVSFSQARLHVNTLLEYECDTFICDEAQYLKNDKTQLFSSVLLLPSRFRLALSGTPLENSLTDVLSILSFLFPFERQKIQDIALDNDKIKSLLIPFLLRRKKDEVLKELPEKLEKDIWISLSEEEKEAYDEIRQDSSLNPLERILRLRQFCCLPQILDKPFLGAKFNQVMSDIAQGIAENKKIIIFSQFTKVLQCMQEKLSALDSDVLYIDGKIPIKQREKVIQEFQESSRACVLLLSLKVGGVGLNLTAGDYVFLYDPWWNEAVEKQAIDRAHRFGRKSKVFAYRYLVIDSVEEKMLELKEKKAGLSHALIDQDVSNALDGEDLDFLLS